ncbi:MAG TPA: hypothetical protein VII99_04115 [Bacteroidia bacterium]
MLKKIFTISVLLSSVIALAQTPVKGPMDGKKFTTEIFEVGKKKPLEPDDLSFNSGKFKSVLFGDQGWDFNKPGKYLITNIDSMTTQGVKLYSWVVDLVNEHEEKLSWSGTFNGDNIEGTVELVNKKGKTEKSFTFNGKMKKKPGQK